MNGAKPPKRKELSRIRDRITFLYVECCRLEKEDSAVRIITDKGTIDVPAGMIMVLLLGPETTVMHRMVQIASESGMELVWVGEQGVRFYAGGSSLSGNTVLLTAQAKIVSNQHLRLSAAKRMYHIRYPQDDFTELSMKQLLEKEGKHVGERYVELADMYGLSWKGMRYNPDNFSGNEYLQNALSCANACLYGLCYAVIYALGLSPGLGIVHTGLGKSFVLDIADVYKEQLTFPVAFSVAARVQNEGLKEPVDRTVRYALRDLFRDSQFLKVIVSDIETVLTEKSGLEEDEGRNLLWAGFLENVSGVVQYGKRL
ncbi:MAG: type I-E CRISPR-associated endonuclease Cas1 [Firmicutes bacterium]|nr:type I-E CRISPR-associated endonuclease Cas1 [Bacillota bacterium]